MHRIGSGRAIGTATVGAMALAVATAAAAWPSGIGSQGAVGPAPTATIADATVTVTPLDPVTRCAPRFEEIELAHTTRPTDSPARLFDSNGAGVAADDLDGDGLADIVLANLEGPNTILWNEGDFTFTAESMRDRSSRAVNLVDIDGDDLLDIVTTHRASGVAAFRNRGDRTFEQTPLRGVGAPAYSMSWGDLDGDGDLDLATASYDAELDQRLRSGFQFSDGAGVYLYRRNINRFIPERLAGRAQGLVTALTDLDLDGRPDLFVGNDFSVDDQLWHNNGRTFVPFTPFTVSAAHPMSFDRGDVDGDGIEELFVTDMLPATTDVRRLAQWIPLMAAMDNLDDPTSSQKIRNVLLVPQSDGTYDDHSERAGIDAAGWAWSARFGDLDNDGDLDLHVVNGMIAAETFHYLPQAELVEPNLMFENRGGGSFGPADWGLGSLASGRGSVLVDLDRDGRLDIVVNNLDSPAKAYRNLRCDGVAVTFSLRQPGTGNTRAVGATVTVVDGDHRLVRSVQSGGGYLSGTPSTVHVGIGDATVMDRAEIRWPDGAVSIIDSPLAGHHYEVTRP